MQTMAATTNKLRQTTILRQPLNTGAVITTNRTAATTNQLIITYLTISLYRRGRETFV